jgi:hypothetical protein
MFVDEVRSVMPSNLLYLDQIKYNIMEIAKQGGHEYVIDRPDEDMDLKKEIQWLKDNGFNVEEWTSRASYEYYPKITVSW